MMELDDTFLLPETLDIDDVPSGEVPIVGKFVSTPRQSSKQKTPRETPKKEKKKNSTKKQSKKKLKEEITVIPGKR